MLLNKSIHEINGRLRKERLRIWKHSHFYRFPVLSIAQGPVQELNSQYLGSVRSILLLEWYWYSSSWDNGEFYLHIFSFEGFCRSTTIQSEEDFAVLMWQEKIVLYKYKKWPEILIKAPGYSFCIVCMRNMLLLYFH